MLKNNRIIINILLFTILPLWIGGCSSDDPEIVQQSNEAYWKISSTVSSTEGSSAIIITGTTGIEWDAEVVEGNTWCAFSSKDYTNSTKSGVVNSGLNVLYVYYKAIPEKSNVKPKSLSALRVEKHRLSPCYNLPNRNKTYHHSELGQNFRHLRRMRIINTSHITVH